MHTYTYIHMLGAAGGRGKPRGAAGGRRGMTMSSGCTRIGCSSRLEGSSATPWGKSCAPWLVWFCIGQLGIVETSVYILGCNSSSHTLQRFRPQLQMEQQQQPVSHVALLVWKLKHSPRALMDALNLLRSDLPCDVEVHTLMRGGKLIARAGTLIKLDDIRPWHINLSEEFEGQAARASEWRK